MNTDHHHWEQWFKPLNVNIKQFYIHALHTYLPSYWLSARAILGILAQGCSSVDQAQQGLYKNDLGQIFPSMAGASEGSK